MVSLDYAPDGSGSNSKLADAVKTPDIHLSTLITCYWDVIHHGWLGNSICPDNCPRCYNTPVFNFDDGDCCEDMCKDATPYVECTGIEMASMGVTAQSQGHFATPIFG
jgi:hypothetical protein